MLLFYSHANQRNEADEYLMCGPKLKWKRKKKLKIQFKSIGITFRASSLFVKLIYNWGKHNLDCSSVHTSLYVLYNVCMADYDVYFIVLIISIIAPVRSNKLYSIDSSDAAVRYVCQVYVHWIWLCVYTHIAHTRTHTYTCGIHIWQLESEHV